MKPCNMPGHELKNVMALRIGSTENRNSAEKYTLSSQIKLSVKVYGSFPSVKSAHGVKIVAPTPIFLLSFLVVVCCVLGLEAGEDPAAFPVSALDLHLAGLWFGSCGPRGRPVPASPEARVPPSGPFISVVLSKLENMLENSLHVNLLLIGIITQLASYPQPLLRSFLLNTNMVFQPSVRSLYQVR